MLATLAFALSSLVASAAASVVFQAGDWPEPRTAATLSAQGPLRALVGEFEASAKQVIVIRHAGGEAGSSFAEALRAALVALGVPSARIRLEPEAGDPDRLFISLSSAVNR
jgi:hypothetical protein